MVLKTRFPMPQRTAVQLSSASTEWFTPPEIAALVRTLLGTIDLDPASCPAANEVVQAVRYFTQDDDGLARQWSGRIFLNPPYDRAGTAGTWAARLVNEYEAGQVEEAVLLVHFRPEARWFVPLWQYPMVIPRRPLRFIRGDGRPAGRAKCAQAIIYMGVRPERFVEVCGGLGKVIHPDD